MLQDFLKAVENDKVVFIFGCTDLGKNAYRIVKDINISVPVIFIDNSLEKQRDLFCGEKVYGIEQIDFTSDNPYYIIASYSFCKEMESQLLERTVKREYILQPDEISLILSTARKTPHQKLKVIVDLAEHCNLNCRGCDHFSPLAKECFTSPEEFDRDMNRLSELFGNKVSLIKLEGGEPLLNPHIVDFIKIAYRYFPQARIGIYTNGLLLLKMSEIFWEVCSKYQVKLEVTKYPIEFDYELIYKKAVGKNVEMQYFAGGESIKNLRHHPLDLDGRQNIENNFYHCFLANNCIMLKNGRLYTCTTIPNMKHFNRYFNKDIKIMEEDGIDIYSDVTYQDIFEFLSRPVQACRYCKVADRTDGHAWGVSKRELNEWI